MISKSDRTFSLMQVECEQFVLAVSVALSHSGIVSKRLNKYHRNSYTA